MRNYDDSTGRVYNVPRPFSIGERILIAVGCALIAVVVLSNVARVFE